MKQKGGRERDEERELKKKKGKKYKTRKQDPSNNLCKGSSPQGEIRKKANNDKKYTALSVLPSRTQNKSKIYI